MYPFSRSPALGPIVLGLLFATACKGTDPSPPAESTPLPSSVIPGKPKLPAELSPGPAAAPKTDPTPEAKALSEFPKVLEGHKGPWFVVTSPAAGVYSEASFERSAKLGWIRSGGRLPVQGPAMSKKGCTPGFYEVVGGGFICGNYGTTNLDVPDVKFSMVAPNLSETLPYVYASNAKHGTPLYKTVPSREQMLRYEPYLEKKDAPDGGAEARPAPAAAAAAPAAPVGAAAAVAAAAIPVRPATETASIAPDAGVALLDPGMADAGIGVETPDKPWWQQEDIKDRLHEMKLEHLEADSDEILARRMVKGFYVAIDRTFRWNDRTWYKTTKGLVAPADRFWQASASKFQGVVLDGAALKLPIAWGYGGRKQVATYRIDPASPTPVSAKSLDRLTAIALTGKSQEVAKTTYLETIDGTWLKSAQVRVTEPGPPPSGLGPDERWIDVDLSSQTVVAFVGDKPVYATLISSGKKSKEKEKDHSTPTGEWRIREKHLTTTMDGDGTAAGDLPYSIEDVPYVMFFHKAYALHGAFWHGNYGVQMSHGCVNLAPLDAKWLFFFTSPALAAGYHGVWSRPESAGTRIVIHD
jgi:lipoprotein-anchoring transpeptidase ErfK/SrfK